MVASNYLQKAAALRARGNRWRRAGTTRGNRERLHGALAGKPMVLRDGSTAKQPATNSCMAIDAAALAVLQTMPENPLDLSSLPARQEYDWSVWGAAPDAWVWIYGLKSSIFHCKDD
ncbi:hypothetical protein G7054_g7624 [Neopestalotiopsis clavispora]|nr:hypothetical protein G7054_g7624 [Neopestalotiopsis clavispora]